MAERTEVEKRAWLDGYKAAAETAASFEVRTGHAQADISLNHGARMVATLLEGQLKRMKKPKYSEEPADDALCD